DEHPARIFAEASSDFLFVALAAVPGHQQVDVAGGSVDYRAGIAGGVFSFVPHDAQVAPGVAAVIGSAHYEVDVARVGAAVFASLAKREERPFCRANDRGYAEGVV